MGPMAQDFYAAFGLGEDDKHIDTVDADGVALAAIQALYRQTQEQQQQIKSLEEQSQKDDAIREENRALTLRVERLEELIEKRFGDQLSEAILK
jgi:predicted lipoprotein